MKKAQPADRSLWRNRDFSLLLSGQVVSFVGRQVQDFALPLVVLAIAGTTAQTGLVLGLNTASFLVFGLVAGALVDRWDRKATMIWCEVGRGLLTVSVAVALWLGHLTMPHLYVVAVLTGVLTTLFQSADTAALPNVVPAKQLSTALGYTHSALNTVRVFGAAFAGILYGIGRVVPFVMNAVAFLVSAASLRFMRSEFQQRETGKDQEDQAGKKLTEDIREGLGWLWHQPVIRFLTLAQAADFLRYGAGYLVIIMLAKELDATSLQIGLVFSGAAVGAVIGALVSDRVTKRYPLGRIAVTMLWAEALVFPLYAVAPSWWLLAAVAAAESLVAPVYTVAMTTYRLSITPDSLQGRTASAVSTLTTGALSVGTMLGGVLIAAVGPQHTVLVASGWLLLIAAVTTANGTVRRAPMATDAAAGEAAEAAAGEAAEGDAAAKAPTSER